MVQPTRGEDRVYLRLDRALATTEWLNYFHNIKVHHLVDTTSDHFSLLLTETSVTSQRRRHRFHFKVVWTRRADCKEVIEEAWNESLNLSTPGGIANGLQRCVDALTTWSNAVFGHILKKIQEKKKALSELTKQDRDGQNGAEINKLRKEINELLDGEELWWLQRSKVQWLGEGDRNTKNFHSRASEHRRKSTISGLWNEEEKWCDDKANIATTAISYFKDIYTTTLPSQIEEVTSLIPVKVTSEMNDSLTQVFTIKEICMALF